LGSSFASPKEISRAAETSGKGRKIFRMTHRDGKRDAVMVIMVALDPFTDEIMRFAWTRLLPLALLAGIVGVFFRAALEGLVAFLVTALRKRSLRRRTLAMPPPTVSPAE
jgi:hypothetical protein